VSKRGFYITTAIDYANGQPHLGHAFEKIGADVIARFRRLAGDDVHFLMGMDEHGQKVARTAAARGMEPQPFVDEIAGEFEATWRKLAISYDQFIRTTAPEHSTGVLALIEAIFARNPDDCYERVYEGWYCVGCEQFKRESEVVDERCAVHPSLELEWSTQRNWFFRLSRYEPFLREHFARHPDFLQPESRRNEILGLFDEGLDDISITRSRLEWAIPFPRPTSDGELQGTWVWFDALPNYLTATGYPAAGFDSLWPADLHVIGKDITRLHAVIWPAMLASAGLPLPRRVWGHGFAYFRGERFSKSGAMKLDLGEAIDRYGADAFRYFLMREIPWDADGSFTWERFDERYAADLANDLGNLVNRVLSMVSRYRGGLVTAAGRSELDTQVDSIVERYSNRMDRLMLHEGAALAMEAVSEANGFVGARAPWKLAKEESRAAELDETLASLVRTLGIVATILSPFMPGKSAEIWRRLGTGSPTLPSLQDLQHLDPAGWATSPGDILFPRVELAASG
jgi:methionyl-tRNA synthetase